VSEIGDKTFFVVILYSSRFKKWVVFLLATLGMVFMHTLSTTVGTVLALILPKLASSIIVVVLFLGFGIWLLVVTFKQ
jgi:putative Ca2+/H+ antiporter (TMEM165/GDT1 family)